MKKLVYVLLVFFLISCGSNVTKSTSTDQYAKGVSATGKDITGTEPEVTVQSILSNMKKANYKAGELLVKFKSDTPLSTMSGVHQAVGAISKRGFALVPNIEHVTLPEGMSVEDAIIQYMSDPNVEYAEPNYIIRALTIPNDTYFGNQWALNNTGSYAGGSDDADVDAPEAWDTTTGSSAIVIAVTDTGVDYNHPDLHGNIWYNSGETDCNDGIDNDSNGYIDDCVGWDFTTCEQYNEALNCEIAKSEDNDPMDEMGHGTHVAGIIGARGNNGEGVTGVMWNVKLMALRFLNAQGIGDTSDAIRAIEYAIENGARIINASWGGYEYSLSLYDAINTANNTSILFVAAAGNEENNNDAETPLYPASYNLPNIISVAATDQNDIRAHFSNFGLNSVDVAAPGIYIFSTVPTWWGDYPGYGEIERFSGTSMSAPHVAGLAGLLYSYYDGVHNTAFSYTQVRDTILRYVDVLPTLQGWIKTGGRINANWAVSSLLIPTNLTATAPSPTEITLSWTDNATGEDGYILERKKEGGNFYEIADLSPDTTTYTDTGLDPLTTYVYRIKVYNNISESFYSDEVSATTPETEPRRKGGGGCSLITGQPEGPVDITLLLIPIVAILIAMRRKER
jgi:subtilisin family serine protease